MVNRLGGLSLPRKSVVRLTDRPGMTLDVYCGRKTTTLVGFLHTFHLFNCQMEKGIARSSEVIVLYLLQ